MKLYQVDAFTRIIYKGNPAGVCILDDNKIDDSELLQNIAMEMNLSETAFLKKDNSEYRLRWFTPETEVTFCGHATLSAAHILYEQNYEKHDKEIVFNTLAGILKANKKGESIELNFPQIITDRVDDNEMINHALNIKPLYTGSDGKRYLVEIEDVEQLKSINPDYLMLKNIGKTAFMVTCKSNDNNYDFYSRFFAPSVGITEDPVTGSAHSYLAPYWGKKLNKKLLKGFQSSKRSGIIECELIQNERVLLRGNAVTVFEILLKN